MCFCLPPPPVLLDLLCLLPLLLLVFSPAPHTSPLLLGPCGRIAVQDSSFPLTETCSSQECNWGLRKSKKRPRRLGSVFSPSVVLHGWDIRLHEAAWSFMDSQLAAEQSHHILLGFGLRKQGIKVVAERTAEGQRFQPNRAGLAKNHAEKNQY